MEFLKTLNKPLTILTFSDPINILMSTYAFLNILSFNFCF